MSARDKSLISRWRGLSGRWRFALKAFAWVLLCSLPLGYCERRYLGHPITRWFDEQQASLGETNLFLQLSGPEVCGLDMGSEPRNDAEPQDWRISVWADKGSLKTDRLNSPERNMAWVAATSIERKHACTARYAFTLSIKEGVLHYYIKVLDGYARTRSVEIERPALMYRLVPPPIREGFRSILPGQCVIMPIHQNEQQQDRFLIELPADKRINVTLVPDYSLEDIGLLSWSIKPKVNQKTVVVWPASKHYDANTFSTQHGTTTESGLHEIVVSRSGMPKVATDSSPYNRTEPRFVYLLMVTWGEETSQVCFEHPNARSGASRPRAP